MRRLTVEELNKIEALNGTLESRYEYIEAIQKIMSDYSARQRVNKNYMKTIMVEKNVFIDIDTKTIKGTRYVVSMRINDLNKENGGYTSLYRNNKSGKWMARYDSEWFDENGNWNEVNPTHDDVEYNG